ncbi:hypothetical protein QTP88_015513 [Uroleucon formosanum]
MKLPGYFKDEIAGRNMRQFIGLRAKSYAYDIEGAVNILSKGVRGHVIRNHLTFNDHMRCLFADDDDDDEDGSDADDYRDKEFDASTGRLIARDCARIVFKRIHRNAAIAAIPPTTQHPPSTPPPPTPPPLPTQQQSYMSYTAYRENISIRSYKHQVSTIRTRSPRITSKRNLSNLSLSPNQNGKKSKFFVSPNKFAVIANNCENSDVSTPSICSKGDSAISPHAVQDNDPPTPPIYIKNIANYSAFNSTLTSITGPNVFTCKSSASHLIVQPSGRNSFNKIVSHLNETDASFHSFSPRFRRPYRVVIRNLHPSTLDTDISSSLDELGHQVKHIYNAKDKNKRPLPLFFVEIY